MSTMFSSLLLAISMPALGKVAIDCQVRQSLDPVLFLMQT